MQVLTWLKELSTRNRQQPSFIPGQFYILRGREFKESKATVLYGYDPIPHFCLLLMRSLVFTQLIALEMGSMVVCLVTLFHMYTEAVSAQVNLKLVSQIVSWLVSLVSAISENCDSPSSVTLVQHCHSEFSVSGEPSGLKKSVYVRGPRCSQVCVVSASRTQASMPLLFVSITMPSYSHSSFPDLPRNFWEVTVQILICDLVPPLLFNAP